MDTPTLADLRVSIDKEAVGNGVMLGDLRQATLADLVAVLKAEGAEEVKSQEQYKVQTTTALSVPKHGRYLVFRLPDEEV